MRFKALSCLLCAGLAAALLAIPRSAPGGDPAGAGQGSGISQPAEAPGGSSAPEVSAVDRLLEQMTLREKVGQLFIVRPDDLAPASQNQEGVTSLTEGMEAALERYPVGGIAMFGKNIVSPDQILSFNRALQAAGRIPFFLSVDEEGGTVARLANSAAFDLPKYKSAAAVAQAGGRGAALEMGRTIGEYLKRYGFNMDFAPDADVNTNPKNPVIGTRAFSSDAGTAADMAEAMAQGLREQGIIPVFKHFPGHGDTAEDSHSGMAVAPKTAEEMRACEWIPFTRARDTDGIMVGHITAPELTGDSTPATLSYPVVTGILREELGFDGLILTDALEMGAIVNEYGTGDAVVKAVQAGCDILLMPGDLQEAFEAVTEAVESGEISRDRLDASVRRILQAKDRQGLLVETGN